MYPYSDSTNTDIKKVLYPDGVKTFNEDFRSSEDYKETETINRFNSIVKTPGIVAKKTEITTRLYPQLVTGNQITISKGIGFTNNGAMIDVPVDISIADLTSLTNYQVPSSTIQPFLILRKTVENYNNRTQPITGVQYPTRSRIKGDSSIVEWAIWDLSLNDNNIVLDDRDIVILGRLTNTSPVTFDVTELTGGRKILRVGEVPFLEITGGVMEGDIDMVNHWEVLNLPQWGRQYYVNNGSVNNLDFLRLFSRVNCQLSLIKSLTFKQSGINYGIQFENTVGTKILLTPAQKPPTSIEIVLQNQFISIPDNNLLYIKLEDNHIGISSNIYIGGSETPDTISGSYIVNSDLFQRASFTSSTFGSQLNNTLLKFPIAYHYYDSVNGVRKLIFADGTILSLNDNLDENGHYSEYLHTDGSNELEGDLSIVNQNAKVKFRSKEGLSSTTEELGLEWTRESPNNSTVIGKFKRLNTVLSESGYNIGDYILDTADNNGNNGFQFLFKQDGRFKVPTPPVEENDVVRKKEYDGKVSKTGDTMTGDLIMINESQVIIKSKNPTFDAQDTEPSTSYQSYKFSRAEGLLGRMIRFSDSSSAGYDSVAEGDLLIETYNNAMSGKATLKLRRADNCIVGSNIESANVHRFLYVDTEPIGIAGAVSVYGFFDTVGASQLVAGYPFQSGNFKYSLINKRFLRTLGTNTTINDSTETELFNVDITDYLANDMFATVNLQVKFTPPTNDGLFIIPIEIRNESDTVLLEHREQIVHLGVGTERTLSISFSTMLTKPDIFKLVVKPIVSLDAPTITTASVLSGSTFNLAVIN